MWDKHHQIRWDHHQIMGQAPPDNMGQAPPDNMGQPPLDNMGPNMIGGDVEGYTNYAPANFQTGGDGFRLGVDAEMVGGQAVVEGYDNEQATCGGYGEELQVGGGSPFNFITDPDTNQSLSIFSVETLLKSSEKSTNKCKVVVLLS